MCQAQIVRAMAMIEQAKSLQRAYSLVRGAMDMGSHVSRREMIQHKKGCGTQMVKA